MILCGIEAYDATEFTITLWVSTCVGHNTIVGYLPFCRAFVQFLLNGTDCLLFRWQINYATATMISSAALDNEMIF